MKFKRTLQRYGKTPEPVTPYQKAAHLWDERIGSSRVQARNWRLMAFGCLMLSAGLAGGMVWLSAQGRVTPYVVEVDRLGEVRAVGPAIESYQPGDAQIAWQLARFIANGDRISHTASSNKNTVTSVNRPSPRHRVAVFISKPCEGSVVCGTFARMGLASTNDLGTL